MNNKTFKSIIPLFIILLSLFIFFISCNLITDSKNDSSALNDGICKTDETGNILSDDHKDWQPRYDHQYPVTDTLSTLPAYPNPTNGACSILYAIGVTAHVQITVNTSADHTIETLKDEMQPRGAYLITWDCRNNSGELLPKGVYRIFIRMETDGKEYQTYGDIQLIHEAM